MSGKTIQFPFFPASPNGKLLSVNEGIPLPDAMNQLGLVLYALQAQMEEIAPYLSDGFTDEEMYKALISKGRLDNRPCLKWRPVKDKL